MTTFLDTSVVIALLDDADAHNEWSVAEFTKCKSQGPALISDIVYCELAYGMPSKAALDEAIATLAIERFPFGDDALYRAGLAFKKYKDENKGPKTGVLPDFLIGAAAEVAGTPLLTANPADFGKYFPALALICP